MDAASLRSAARPLLEALESRQAPAVAIWDGGGTDNNWTTAENWQGDVAPVAGDQLLFGGTVQQASNNDFPAGTTFQSINTTRYTPEAPTEGYGFTLSGNALRLDGGESALRQSEFAPANQFLLDVALVNGATLVGAGNVGSITTVGGIVKPQAFVATFAGIVDGLNVGGDFILDVASTFSTHDYPVTSYHSANGTSIAQVRVQGSVNLGNSTLVIVAEVDVDWEPYLPFFTYAYHDRMTLITNDGFDPVVGTFAGLPEGSTVSLQGHVFRLSYRGGDGNDVTLTNVSIPIVPGEPAVAYLMGNDGSSQASFLPYGAEYHGEVRVAMGDLSGDGIDDVITGTGPGAPPHVKVFDGASGALVRSFMAFDPAFLGGITVAAGDVNGDGDVDLVVGAGAGAEPHVVVFSGGVGYLLHSFMAYDPAFRGGVNVAAGDVNGDGLADVITGAGAGAAPHVCVFSGADGTLLRSLMAYDAAFLGGVNVAAGDVNGDGIADVITGAGAGASPHVKVFDGASNDELFSFLAYDEAFRGGVHVAAGDVDGDGLADVVTGAGAAAPHVCVFSGLDLALMRSFPCREDVSAGVSVAAGDLDGDGLDDFFAGL